MSLKQDKTLEKAKSPIQKDLAIAEIAVKEVMGELHTDLYTKRKTDDIVKQRRIMMYLLKTKDHSFKKIATEFLRRDHSTVIWAINKVEDILNSPRIHKQLYYQYTEIIHKFNVMQVKIRISQKQCLKDNRKKILLNKLNTLNEYKNKVENAKELYNRGDYSNETFINKIINL